MDNDTIIKLATIIAGLVTTLFGAWITYKMKQVERTAKSTHELVNYQSMLLARQHELTARSLAKLTGLPDDVTQAETATRLRQESEQKQESLRR